MFRLVYVSTATLRTKFSSSPAQQISDEERREEEMMWKLLNLNLNINKTSTICLYGST